MPASYALSTIRKEWLLEPPLKFRQQHIKDTLDRAIREYLALENDREKLEVYLDAKLQSLRQNNEVSLPSGFERHLTSLKCD